MIKKPNTIKELCEFMWYLENKYNLLDFEIDGVKVWQYKRMEIYYLLSEKLKIFTQAHSKLNKKDLMYNFLSFLKNSLIKNPFFLLSEKNILIFSHERSKRVEDSYIDIYSKFLIDELQSKNVSFLELERPYLGKHIRKDNINKRYLDFNILLVNFFKFFVKVNLDKKQINLIDKINQDINRKLNIEIDVTSIFLSSVKRFKINYYLYQYLLKKIKPKVVYLVVSYAYADLIKAAKDLNIETIELQHGTFSEYHLGYSFPNYNHELDYFPDKFLVWNVYWKNLIKFPIKKNKIGIYPFYYLESQKNKYSNKKIENQLIVLSQGVLGEQIAYYILHNFKKFEKFNIKYKLHPGEYDRWELYPSLLILSKKDNVQIIKDCNLYELFSTSYYQLGVFSTAIYEGEMFNCKTILLDLPGIEYMIKFIKFKNLLKTDRVYIEQNLKDIF